MKTISFNCNSVRPRLHQLEAIIEKYQPDIIGLQETKVRDEEFPSEAISALGYDSIFHGQKTHYGVAILYKNQHLVESVKGFPGDVEDSQRRFIAATFKSSNDSTFSVLNGYFPQGETRDHPTKFPNKKKYYEDIFSYLQSNFTPNDRIIVMGDMNVAPEDKDIGTGEDSKKRWLKQGKCSFLPEEREWLQILMDWGLEDSYRLHHPHSTDFYSWFDYRTRGFEFDPKRGLRIDFILATKKMMAQCKAAGVDYDIRAMEKPSDHCPVWAEWAEF